MFKVLIAVIYCIIDNHVCFSYVFLHKYPKLSAFDKGFEDAYYNEISGIGIPELLMDIVSCYGFVKYNTPTVILTCQRHILSYYLSRSSLILPKTF